MTTQLAPRRFRAAVLAASIAAAAPGLIQVASAQTVPNGGTLTFSGTAQVGGVATQVFNVTPPGTVTGFNNVNFLQASASLSGATPAAGTGGATVFYGAINTTDPGNGQAFNASPTAYGITLADNYEALFSGYFNAPAAGNYTFALNSDDGSVLYLDGVQIVNDNNYQGEANPGPQTSSVVTLSAGVHDLVAGYYQGGGGAGITAYYQAPSGPNSTALTTIPLNDGTNQILTGPQASVNFGSSVNVAAGTSGTLQILYALQSQFSALTFNGGTCGLTILGSSAQFGSTTFSGGGTITLAPAGATLSGAGTTASPYVITNPASTFAQDIALGQASDGGTAVTIVKTGYNSILLDNITAGVAFANSFVAGTTFNIQGGSLVVNGSSTGSNPLSDAGVSLNAATGVGSTIQNSTLTLASQGGNVTYDNPVIIGAGVTANIIAQQANQQTGAGPQIGVSGMPSPSATSAFTATLGGVNSLSIPATSTLDLSSADGETLALGSAFTVAANGTLNATGGTVAISNGGAVAGSFNNTGATLNIATTGLTGAGTVAESGGTTNVNVANPGFTGAVNLSGGTTYFNVATAFTAASGVHVNNGGSLTLGTADSNSANVTVASGGTFQLSADQGGGTPGTPPTAAIAGTLDINANQSAGYNVALNGGTIQSVNGTRQFSGNLTISGNVTFGGAGQALTVAGAIGGTGSLVKAGAETVTLEGTNSYGGSTTVNAGTLLLDTPVTSTTVNVNSGTLQLGAANVLPTNAAVAVNGVLDLHGNSTTVTALTGTGSVTSSSGPATLTAAGTTSFSGTLNDGGTGNVLSVIVPASATLTLGTASGYTGGTTVNSGGRFVINSNAAAGAGPVTLSGGTVSIGSQPGGPIYLNGFGPVNSLSNAASYTLNGGATLSAGLLTLTDNNGNEARSAYYTAEQTFTNLTNTTGFNANFTYQAGGNRGADGVTFCLQTTGPTALGGGGGMFGYQGIGNNNAAVELNLYSGANNGAGTAFNVNGGIGNANGTYGVNSTNNLVTSPVDITSGDPIGVSLVYNGLADTLKETLTDLTTSQSFSFTYTDVNLNTILGGNMAYVGFSGGTGGVESTQTITNFTLSSGVAAGGIASIANAIQVSPATTSTLENNAPANGNAVSVGSVTLGAGSTLNVTPGAALASNSAYSVTTGAVTLSGSATVNVANNGSGTGTITIGAVGDGGSAFGLTKAGAGTLFLNSVNTYTGLTSVTGGTLAGNGTLAGAASIGNGATLAPSGGQPTLIGGPITITGNLAFAGATSTFLVNLSSPTSPGITYDQVQFGHAVTLAGATLSLSDLAYASGTPAANDKFWIMDGESGSSAVSGIFTGLPNGTTFTGPNGVFYTVRYDVSGDPDMSGNDVLLTTTVPEPTGLALAGFAAMGLLRCRRRRRYKC